MGSAEITKGGIGTTNGGSIAGRAPAVAYLMHCRTSATAGGEADFEARRSLLLAGT